MFNSELHDGWALLTSCSYVCRKSGVGYEHFERGKCPLYDDSVARDEEAIKKAEAEARAKVQAENPDIAPEDLQIKVSAEVAERERQRRARVEERQAHRMAFNPGIPMLFNQHNPLQGGLVPGMMAPHPPIPYMPLAPGMAAMQAPAFPPGFGPPGLPQVHHHYHHDHYPPPVRHLAAYHPFPMFNPPPQMPQFAGDRNAQPHREQANQDRERARHEREQGRYERDQVRHERDQARHQDRGQARQERDQARQERGQARQDREQVHNENQQQLRDPPRPQQEDFEGLRRQALARRLELLRVQRQLQEQRHQEQQQPLPF